MPTLSQVARRYVGKRETPNNSGFIDKAFEAKMKQVGWLKSQAWCTYFTELSVVEWATEIGRPDIAKLATKLFSGSATATYKNVELYAMQNPKSPIRVSKTPVENSVAIYRHGIGWQGHAGVTEKVSPTKVCTNVEGNTNNAGGREGIEVAVKKRAFDAPFAPKGLNIVGFIYFV